MLSFSITVLVLGLFGAAILRRHLREAKILRLREISHKERMMAMERGIPIPNGDGDKLDSPLLGAERTASRSAPMGTTRAYWTRLAALALGLTLVFGGIGLLPAIYFQTDQEMAGTWPFGLLPILMGTGLLLFVRLSRDLAEKIDRQRESR